MRGKRQMRELARLAAVQRVVLDERRQRLGQRCAESDDADAAEVEALADHRGASGKLDAVLAAPRLCLDELAIAALQFQGSEAELSEARGLVGEARRAEDQARSDYSASEYRQRLLGRMVRDNRRKAFEKTDAAAIGEAVAIGIARERGP